MVSACSSLRTDACVRSVAKEGMLTALQGD